MLLVNVYLSYQLVKYNYKDLVLLLLQDALGNRFATRGVNVFVIGRENKPLISLPKGKGIRLSIL